MLTLAGAGLATTSFAQEAPTLDSVAKETAYIFNTLLFLIGGFLVVFMAAGFAMLEAGLVRAKNVSMQCLKNIALYSDGWHHVLAGSATTSCIRVLTAAISAHSACSAMSFDAVGTGADGTYSTASDWYFQMAFVAATASIVSGTVAERIKLWPFLIFTVMLTGIMYPISGSWKWGAGFLDAAGFNDFAGSTIVHSVGGWAALTGAIILGARKGKYTADGKVVPLLASNIPLATLGTFILWLGWFGFNGASQLAAGTIGDISDVSRIFANTNLAAAGGVVATLITMQALYGKLDVTMALNGALAGLVSITAEPLTPSPIAAILIGGVGGVIVVLTVPLLDKFKIDDVVGAIPVHLIAGIWGTLAVVLTNSEATLGAQILGIVSYGVFTVVFSTIVWLALKYTIGLRVSKEEEAAGLDRSEIGVEAYPEFTFGRG